MIRKGAVLVCALGLLAAPTQQAFAAAPAARSPEAPRLRAASQVPGAPQPSPSADASEGAEGSDASEGAPGQPEPPPDGGGAGEDGPDESGTGEGAAEAKRLEELRARIEDLHDEVGSAADAYNAAAEKVKKQQRVVTRLNRAIARNRNDLTENRDRAGAMARAQYRSGGMPPGSRIFLDGDPDAFLDSLSLLHKGQYATVGVIRELGEARTELDKQSARAEKEWKKLEARRTKQAAAKKRVEGRLERAEKLESELAADERAQLRELEAQTSYQRQLRWLKSGLLKEIDGKASEQGKKALAFATAQIGKDYEWGATGPETFDCSGLTLRAWEAAGTTIPRTSQEQWKGLARVDMEQMRPGDLIIYKNDASHVGMYVGEGTMVHAPRTGRQVRIEGVGALPVLGVVRPDAEPAGEGESSGARS